MQRVLQFDLAQPIRVRSSGIIGVISGISTCDGSRRRVSYFSRRFWACRYFWTSVDNLEPLIAVNGVGQPTIGSQVVIAPTVEHLSPSWRARRDCGAVGDVREVDERGRLRVGVGDDWIWLKADELIVIGSKSERGTAETTAAEAAAVSA